MSQSTGPPQGREDFEEVNSVVLPNEEVGDMVLTYFVDLKNEVIFVIIEGGMESAYFHYKKELTYIENIDMIGVVLEEYVQGISVVCRMASGSDETPLPPLVQMRDRLLTRARVKRSASTN